MHFHHFYGGLNINVGRQYRTFYSFMCMFCGSLFVLFCLAIVLSVLRFMGSDYPFGIFKLFLAMGIWIKRFFFNNNKLFWTQTVHTPGKQCRLRWTTWKESGLQCLLNGPLIRNLLSWANQKSRISFFFQKAWTKSMQPLYILLHLSCFEIWWFNYTMLKDRL